MNFGFADDEHSRFGRGILGEDKVHVSICIKSLDALDHTSRDGTGTKHSGFGNEKAASVGAEPPMLRKEKPDACSDPDILAFLSAPRIQLFSVEAAADNKSVVSELSDYGGYESSCYGDDSSYNLSVGEDRIPPLYTKIKSNSLISNDGESKFEEHPLTDRLTRKDPKAHPSSPLLEAQATAADIEDDLDCLDDLSMNLVPDFANEQVSIGCSPQPSQPTQAGADDLSVQSRYETDLKNSVLHSNNPTSDLVEEPEPSIETIVDLDDTVSQDTLTSSVGEHKPARETDSPETSPEEAPEATVVKQSDMDEASKLSAEDNVSVRTFASFSYRACSVDATSSAADVQEAHTQANVDPTMAHIMSIMADEASYSAAADDIDKDGEEMALYTSAISNSLLYENKLIPDNEENTGRSIDEEDLSGFLFKSSFNMGSTCGDSFARQLLSGTSDDGGSDTGGEQPEMPSRPGKPSIITRSKSEILEIEDKKFSPNRPHPALDYPLLYFFLRRFPWLFDHIKVLYAFRWRLSYPLQRNVPFSRTLRKAGIYLTWGEVLLLVPFFVAVLAGILYTTAFPSVAATGKVARFALLAAMLFAQKNSLVTLLLGMPFDRSIFYHKLAGRVAGVTGVLHTISFFVDPAFKDAHEDDVLGGAFTGGVNASGSLIMLLIAGIIATSVLQIRRRMFEVFYYLHVIFAVGMIVSAFFHSGKTVPIVAFSTWGVDLFIRSIVMARTRYPRKATLKIISDTVIEVSFPKTAAFAYNPGQYIYIAIPELSWLQWHPFSISSSPKQNLVTLHIRKAGDWTSTLFKLGKKETQVDILLEGPYGNIGVDMMDDRKYKNIMLISGGIGITPMQSICDQLLYETAKNRRQMRRLKFIWIERDPVLMHEAEFVRRTSSIGSVGSMEDLEEYLSTHHSMHLDDLDELDDLENPSVHGADEVALDQATLNQQVTALMEERQSIDIASQLLSLLPPGRTTDEELEKMYDSGHIVMEDDDENQDNPVEGNQPAEKRQPADLEPSEPELQYTRRPSSVVSRFERRPSSVVSIVDDETSFADNSAPWLSEAAPVVESLVNVLDMQVYLTGQAPPTGNIPFARFGRPDIKAIFLEMKHEAIESGDKRVAVCVSAPGKLTDLCQKACIIYSDDKVRFDFHSESLAL